VLSRNRGAWPRSSVTRGAAWSPYVGVIAACVAVGVSLFAFFDEGESPSDLKLLIGLGVTLSAIVLSLQIETLVRFAQRTRTQERYAKLLATVEDYPDLLEVITQIAEASVETLKRSRVEPFKQSVPEFLKDARGQLQDLAQGRRHTAGGDKALLPRVFADTRNLIQGTTDGDDTTWWQQAIGRKFLKLNSNLISGKHKGKVVRVWILKERPLDETREVIEDHWRANVTVLIVHVDELDEELLVNMTIMDEWFLHQDVTNRLRRTGEYLFSENREDLDRAQARFRRIVEVATPYEGPKSIDILFDAVEQRKPSLSDVPTEEDAQADPSNEGSPPTGR
jgi:hypothetical protein